MASFFTFALINPSFSRIDFKSRLFPFRSAIKTDSIKANVVSMPSLDIFMQQKEDFQNSIIDPDKPILVVECSHPNSWYKILNRGDMVIGIESFGESAPGNELLKHFGFTKENVIDAAKSLIND